MLLISSAACVTIAVQAGHARNAVITHDQEVRSIKFYLLAQSLGIISCTVGRIAFIMYLRRLVPLQSKTRIALLMLLGLQPPVNVVPVLLIFAGCKDIRAVFDYSITGVYCLPPRILITYSYFQGGSFYLLPSHHEWYPRY